MAQTLGPTRAWPCTLEAVGWTEDQPHVVIDLLATNTTGTLERHMLIPMLPDDAWQLALFLQEALERKGVPRPKDLQSVVSETETEEH